ncbi:MAG: ferrous iron transport protein B [Tannerella sp.]|jgi:ferrous iron transport protein B|nr:ferrous iron transport protein B [Tannerella sp.]
MKLSDLHNGETAVIVKVYGHGGFRRRIMEMGFVRGQKVTSILNSPLNDPVKYAIMGYEVSLRHSEADMVETLYENEIEEQVGTSAKEYKRADNHRHTHDFAVTDEQDPAHLTQFGQIAELDSLEPSGDKNKHIAVRKNIINVALAGNPNSGKTSLFNALSGRSEHVGNYSGVTVDAKTGHFNYKGYHFNITDLPGTYSLSAYSPEEKYVRHHIFEKMPDVIINAVVASNMERNLFLTTELVDLNPRMVVALNMFDELEASGAQLDYGSLGGMIGVPMIPTIAKNSKGLDNLLDTVIDVFENRNLTARHVHINYGAALEPHISKLSAMMRKCDDIPRQFPTRYWAIKVLEQDADVEAIMSRCADFAQWKRYAAKAAYMIEAETKNDVETLISDAKYGFIQGALQETYVEGTLDSNKHTRRIDRLVTNKWLGFPIFILLMTTMFMVTFYFGAWPQEWLETGVGWLGKLISNVLPDGPVNDMLVDGVIGGVGSVMVFLPNILILFMFISFMEDSGYMARAAFIMDRIMHRMGLHGKSFIPLIMGFGCNVPAIMAARTIESHSSRLITILINPFVSCSARLPVLLLLAGTFFPRSPALVLLGLYLGGILMAVLTARLFRRTFFRKDETPFVMELPPYRMPTMYSILRHVWDKSKQYLKKMGGVILLVSIIIWFLGYYPQSDAVDADIRYEQSYLGRIGKFCEPVVKPLGLNWKASVALVSGTAAKEVIVSTLGVIYKNEDEAALSSSLASSGDFTPRSALAFMVFVLLYFPCIASLAAIGNESGSRKWIVFSIVYNTLLAWVAAYLVFII